MNVVELVTDESDIANPALNEIYGPQTPVRFSGDPANFSCRLRFASAGDLGADHVRHTMDVRVTVSPVGYFLANTVLRGCFDELSVGGRLHRVRAGQVALASHPTDLVAGWSDIDVQTLRLPTAVIDRVAREQTGTRGAVRFDGLAPVSEQAERRWYRLTRRVHEEMAAPDSMLEEPLICAQMADLIAATALTTFANSALSDVQPRPRPQTTPDSIVRAMAFIEANASLPISVSDIAHAAGVSPRALQYGFTRHREMTPMAYLRQIRLRAAHDALRAADPSRGATVAQIARQWGFGNPGRFAGAYRAAFGCSPVESLRD